MLIVDGSFLNTPYSHHTFFEKNVIVIWLVVILFVSPYGLFSHIVVKYPLYVVRHCLFQYRTFYLRLNRETHTEIQSVLVCVCVCVFICGSGFLSFVITDVESEYQRDQLY